MLTTLLLMAASGWVGWYVADTKCDDKLLAIEVELQQDQKFPCETLLDVCLGIPEEKYESSKDDPYFPYGGDASY